MAQPQQSDNIQRLRGIRHGVPWDTGAARGGSKRGKAPRYLALDPLLGAVLPAFS